MTTENKKLLTFGKSQVVISVVIVSLLLLIFATYSIKKIESGSFQVSKTKACQLQAVSFLLHLELTSS